MLESSQMLVITNVMNEKLADQWEELACELGLRKVERDEIENQSIPNVEKSMEVIKRWKMLMGRQATITNFVAILKKLHYCDLAVLLEL